MFTGFNSDVEFNGRVYHVQTEDGGLDNPVLETRIYIGGQVIVSVRDSYADLADSPDYSNERIQRRMRDQHRALIEDLECGRLDKEPLQPLLAEVHQLDPDNLVEEYIEDWIEASQFLNPASCAQERDIDDVQRNSKKTGWLGRRRS